ILCKPLSITLATGLFVLLARFRAAVTLPDTILSRTIRIKLSSIFDALFIAINLSKKTQMATIKQRMIGIINGPPFVSRSKMFIVFGFTSVEEAALTESVILFVSIC